MGPLDAFGLTLLIMGALMVVLGAAAIWRGRRRHAALRKAAEARAARLPPADAERPGGARNYVEEATWYLLLHGDIEPNTVAFTEARDRLVEHMKANAEVNKNVRDENTAAVEKVNSGGTSPARFWR